jgi:uncharacterized DUF497 family protein
MLIVRRIKKCTGNEKERINIISSRKMLRKEDKRLNK